ncbi:hypothetical protein EHQ76_16340 [Leptospira barantonii]|uniref:Uncharacterized protein n=1 Tax=Leptospira barantonii TaxID=2023184 RepID=A0A5F2AZ92_9LEPT|nr:hypothetical protein [Leptospira barantonii]TGL96164.1 hypothetical protein EHQ76_16340 [Leptospira barantonii]
MGKLTVRCPRCYESFLFDPTTAGKHGVGYFEKGSQEENPYRKNFLDTLWENLKRTIYDFRSRFQNIRPFAQTPGKRLARNFLLILLAIGIVRTCFFSPFQDLRNPDPFSNSDSPQEIQPQEVVPEEPKNPPSEEQSKPQFQI